MQHASNAALVAERGSFAHAADELGIGDRRSVVRVGFRNSDRSERGGGGGAQKFWSSLQNFGSDSEEVRRHGLPSALVLGDGLKRLARARGQLFQCHPARFPQRS